MDGNFAGQNFCESLDFANFVTKSYVTYVLTFYQRYDIYYAYTYVSTNSDTG